MEIVASKEVSEEYSALFDKQAGSEKKALEEANKELEAFCYAVSHDLRAPLRRAKGYTEAALENLDEAQLDDVKDCLMRTSLTLSNMNQLINDLLRLSKMQRHCIQPTEFNISMLAKEVSLQLRDSHEYKVISRIHEDVWAVGDQGLLKIVLENLLGNAWKYSRNSERPHVEFGASNFHGKNVYYVKDNGVGFDMHYAFKLFNPFQRLHTQKDFEGTGIGLATVKRIICRHGGRIWAESTLGKGATFYFTLD